MKYLFCFVLSLLPFTLHPSPVPPSSPLDIPLFLSGNFGELRSDHFHSGIDFKTQGQTGLPVKSVADGYVARISVSPTGYGRAVYVAHSDGTTSVYGHLDRFISHIETAVRDSQYKKETFAINLYFEPETFPLKQGEIFAYSGNTGSSGGPHLHFELRDTKTERPFDPLPFFKGKIQDKIAPKIHKIKLYNIDNKGIIINDSIAWGKIYAGLKAYDKMNGTQNIYGVKDIALKVDGQEVFHSYLNDFSFDDSRYINSFIDWQAWRFDKEFFMKSYIDPGNRLEFYTSEGNGEILIDEERAYNFEYTLKDAFGNRTVKNFTVYGKKTKLPENEISKCIFYWNQNNYFKRENIEIYIPAGSLYRNVYFDETDDALPFAPLHRPCQLTLTILNDTLSDKTKYGIAAVRGKKMDWIGGFYNNGKITANVRELGEFVAVFDTIPPTITRRSSKKPADSDLFFRISDDFSGIERWQATIDGQFVLFEYDAKTGNLFCIDDRKFVEAGRQRLVLEVWDRAGNVSYTRLHPLR